MRGQLTIQEIIEHCDRKLARELPGSIFHREHEAVKSYLLELLQFRSVGLEPCDYKAMAATMEQCEEAKRQLNELIGAVGGAGFEHIKELARQDKAGRLEVLPCRPGDTVYTVDKIRGAYELIEWRAVEISIDSHCGIVVLEHPHNGIKTRRGCDFEAFGVAAFLDRGMATIALWNKKTGVATTEVAEK